MESRRESSATPTADRQERLVTLSQQVLGGKRLLVASNRGPIEHVIDRSGQVRARRASGGVATALAALGRYVPIIWIASAISEGDRRVLEKSGDDYLPSPFPGQDLRVRLIPCAPAAYHKHYNIFSNPLLWFIQHQMWNLPYSPNIDHSTYDAWHGGYVTVNQAFAQAVIKEAQQGDTAGVVMLHDYHLYLVPQMVRQQLPDALIQHFVHIPWPAPSYWQVLPDFMRRAICASLCANDILGFQTPLSAHNFLYSCETFLDEVEVDYVRGTICLGGRTVLVRSYPISIDVAAIRRIARSGRVQQYVEKLRAICGEKTIVRVDRLEPSKNILRGFRAFEQLLDRYPEFIGRVKFLAFLVPSRTRIRQYQAYSEEVTKSVAAIRARYARPDWQPIELFYENNYAQAMAGMQLYDVLLVNPVSDGMNLVAKEGPTVNTQNGVLILSEGAGAYDQLKEGALTLAPTDIEATVEALRAALTMPLEERSHRLEVLRQAIEREDLATWLLRQFSDLATVIAERAEPARLGSAPPPRPL